MASVKRTTKTLDILKSYQGKNPYILTLKRDVCINGREISDFICDYVLRNHQIKPKHIDKIIRIADWYGESRQKELEIDFTPKKLKIITYLGDTPTSYHCFVQYRKSVEPAMWFIPKKAVLTNFLVEDYSKIEVDFDRYDRLSNFQRILFDHQKEAVKFLLSRKKCILADDMGLGKSTEVSVAAIEGNFDSVLIICPAGLKNNWKRELSFYIPDREISIIDSLNNKTKSELEEFLGYAKGKSGKNRNELLEEAKTAGKWQFNRFVILNYDILDEFYKIPNGRSQIAWEETFEKSPMLQYITNKKTLIIADESHLLSNPKSNRYKVLKSLINRGKPDSIYLVTGTPLTNDPTNLYSILKLIDEPITDDYKYYVERYCGGFNMVHPKDKTKKEQIVSDFFKNHGVLTWKQLKEEERNKLTKMIESKCRMLLIPKPDNIQNLDELRDRISHIYLRRTKEDLNLPQKTVHEIFFNLSAIQRNKYEQLWQEYEKEQKENDKDKELNKALLEGGLYRRYLSNEMVSNTIKLADKLISEGEKIVIACCFDEEIYTLKKYFGEKSVLYNGKCSLKQKDSAVSEFMKNNNIKVFLGNLQSASVGITLVSSSKLIFNDFSYLVSENQQMEDRIYRVGQNKPVDIYYQIFSKTQYEHMWNIVLRKKTIINAVIKKEDEKNS